MHFAPQIINIMETPIRDICNLFFSIYENRPLFRIIPKQKNGHNWNMWSVDNVVPRVVRCKQKCSPINTISTTTIPPYRFCLLALISAKKKQKANKTYRNQPNLASGLINSKKVT